MNKKTIFTAIASVALIAVVGIGGSLAYFTDSENNNNILTMGKVDISLTETSTGDDDYTITDNGLRFENVLPGDKVSKKPTIALEKGSSDAYIRVRVSTDTNLNNYNPDEFLDLLDIDGTQWVKQIEDVPTVPGGSSTVPVIYYYLQTPLTLAEGGLSSVDFFTTASIPLDTWGNSMADGSITLFLRAEAIQKDNIENQLVKNAEGKIIGWPEAVIEKYVPLADRSGSPNP